MSIVYCTTQVSGQDSSVTDQDSTATQRSQKRVTKMMAMVMGSYYLLYAPSVINELIEYDPLTTKVCIV